MQKVIIIGNLGKDPEERHSSQGSKFITFSVAVRVNKEKTQWYDVLISESKISNFENMLPYLSKGSKICIVGGLMVGEPFEGKDGNVKIPLKVSVDSLNFLGGEKKKSQTKNNYKQTSFAEEMGPTPF